METRSIWVKSPKWIAKKLPKKWVVVFMVETFLDMIFWATQKVGIFFLETWKSKTYRVCLVKIPRVFGWGEMKFSWFSWRSVLEMVLEMNHFQAKLQVSLQLGGFLLQISHDCCLDFLQSLLRFLDITFRIGKKMCGKRWYLNSVVFKETIVFKFMGFQWHGMVFLHFQAEIL